MQGAEAALGTEYTGVVLGTVQTHDPFDGVTHVGVGWNGTYTNGNAVTGVIDLFWDPNTMNAISVTRDWYTTADGSEPEVAQERFMYRGVTDDIALGIPNP